MPPGLTIRDARNADCDALTGLCHRSKAIWGYDAEFMRLSRDAVTVTPARLRKWTVRVAESPEGKLLGVAAVRVAFEARRWQLEAELELLFIEPGPFLSGERHSSGRQARMDSAFQFRRNKRGARAGRLMTARRATSGRLRC